MKIEFLFSVAIGFIAVSFAYQVCSNKQDVGILLGVNRRNFNKVKVLLEKFARDMNVDTNESNLGIITYSVNVMVNLRFSDNQGFSNVVEQIRKLHSHPSNGLYDTGFALTIASRELFGTQNGNRPNIPDVMIVFTDGKNSKGINNLRMAMDINENFENVSFLAVGIGNDISKDELRVIAKANENNVILADLDELESNVGQIINLSCLRY